VILADTPPERTREWQTLPIALALFIAQLGALIAVTETAKRVR
jgi:hypothetical protein